MRACYDGQQDPFDQRHISFYIYLPVRHGESCGWVAVPFRAGDKNPPRCVDPLDEFFVERVIRCTEEDDHVDPAQSLFLGFIEGWWESWKEFVFRCLGDEVGDGTGEVDLAM